MGGYLHTERLALRRFTTADVDDLAVLHGHPEVMRYIDDGRPVPRVVVEQEQLPRILREYDELPNGQGCFAAVEKSSGTFLGWVSLRPASSVGLQGGTELGYRMLPSVSGRIMPPKAHEPWYTTRSPNWECSGSWPRQ